jgi:hypothetical protein
MVGVYPPDSARAPHGHPVPHSRHPIPSRPLPPSFPHSPIFFALFLPSSTHCTHNASTTTTRKTTGRCGGRTIISDAPRAETGGAVEVAPTLGTRTGIVRARPTHRCPLSTKCCAHPHPHPRTTHRGPNALRQRDAPTGARAPDVLLRRRHTTTRWLCAARMYKMPAMSRRPLEEGEVQRARNPGGNPVACWCVAVRGRWSFRAEAGVGTEDGYGSRDGDEAGVRGRGTPATLAEHSRGAPHSTPGAGQEPASIGGRRGAGDGG